MRAETNQMFINFTFNQHLLAIDAATTIKSFKLQQRTNRKSKNKIIANERKTKQKKNEMK